MIAIAGAEAPENIKFIEAIRVNTEIRITALRQFAVSTTLQRHDDYSDRQVGYGYFHRGAQHLLVVYSGGANFFSCATGAL